MTLIGGSSTFEQCHFENNTVVRKHNTYVKGGAIYATGGSTIEISICFFFKLNKAFSSGGTIYFSGKKLLIKSSSFKYNTAFGTSSHGGAIYSDGNSICVISKTLFKGNDAESSGGAIFNYNNRLIIEKSVFEKNYARNKLSVGGAVFTFCHGYCSISDSSFKGNEANADGGDIFNSGKKMNIRASFFENNKVKSPFSCGGALYSYKTSQCNISNCSFQANTAKFGGEGIAFVGLKLSIKTSHFKSNVVFGGSGLGAAVYVSYNSSCDISECSFKWNVAMSSGGAIFSSGKKLIIELSSFHHNTAFGKSGNGGAISLHTTSVCVISSSLFSGNKAGPSGGAMFARHTKLTILKSSFEDNSARAGGAVFAFCKMLCSISDTDFTRNKAISAGGTIFASEKHVIITSSIFEENISFGFGGALCMYNTSICNISKSFFRKNKAQISGGSAFTLKTDVLLIDKSSFEDGMAELTNGGVIASKSSQFNDGTRLLIKSSRFQNSTAFLHGGAIYVYFGVLCNNSNSSFIANKAMHSGGGVYYFGEDLSMEESSFKENLALEFMDGGGAIFARSSFGYQKEHGVKIISSSFENNNSSGRLGNGGAILLIASNLSCDISDCFFKKNMAMVNGGAIHCRAGANLLVKNSVFESNSAHDKYKGDVIYAKGGAIFANYNSTCYISNCSFHGNMANTSGAIDFSGSKLTIRSSIFQNNSASGKMFVGNGAAIYLHSHSICDVSNCSFRTNKARFRGGAIAFVGLKLIVKFSYFHNNKIFGWSGDGAAIYVSSNSICHILECSFNENKAKRLGGAIYYHGTKLLVKGSSFENNTALGIDGHGGAIYVRNYDDTSTACISNSFFDRNTASFRGGAIMVIEGKMLIKKSTIKSLPYPHRGSHIQGQLLHSVANVILENVLLQDMDLHSAQSSPMVHQGYDEKTSYTAGNPLNLFS